MAYKTSARSAASETGMEMAAQQDDVADIAMPARSSGRAGLRHGAPPRYTEQMTGAGLPRRIQHTLQKVAVASCLWWISTLALAQMVPAVGQTAGMVKRVAGVVALVRGGLLSTVHPGLIVQVGDTFRTGPDGAVALALADDTLLSVGPDSELQVTAFSFDSTTQDGNLLASVWRGTVAFVTGLIAKKAPDNVRVQTRTVVLGVRGTEFIVDAGRGAP